MVGYHLADLSLPPNRIFVGDGDLTAEKLEWAQPADMWTLVYYEHTNAVTQQNSTALVEPGTIVVFAPGVRGAHGRVGPDTHFQFLTFSLPGLGKQIHSIPRLITDRAHVFADLRRASSRITDATEPAVAFVWNFLWCVSEPKSRHRGRDVLYQVEAYVRQNLGRKLTVNELGAHAGLSQRQLLRLFREEHNMTVQEYVRQLKVQEATRLLLSTDLPVKAVASRVGISDLQEFNKLIRWATGASPSAYRAGSN
ncbi:MAG: helix-turn-helix transcriptional regulator [Armatimonadetes bacterium]|nr:helix-turn-helix transcriptional regulator [Armatimonadota bacterium]MBS1711413.1 helix-turn-helix transcriptional regulator [Armatimonadota bacterium]MBX3107662.1 helix-turn-helix transcriptional regulator [Fimbriimonadaceae bacterium]